MGSGFGDVKNNGDSWQERLRSGLASGKQQFRQVGHRSGYRLAVSRDIIYIWDNGMRQKLTKSGDFIVMGDNGERQRLTGSGDSTEINGAGESGKEPSGVATSPK